jgi:curved DNA-binding protein
MKNYYDVLGVDEKATSADITKAFKDLAKKHHPDRGGDESKFKEINEAHDTLKNSQKRHDYDTMRKFGSTGTGGGQHPFFNEDIFGDFFSGFSGGDMDFGGSFNFTRGPGGERIFRQNRQPRGNRNVQVRMAVSIKEAMNHNEKTINYKLPSGRDEFATVKIPAGVQHGVTFKFQGMGDDSIKNMPRGDLMVVMSVLDTDKTIDCFQAVRGHEFNLKTLEDKIIKVKVPAGTQPGTMLTLKGQGMPVHKTIGIRGNLYVKVHVLIPQLSAADLKKIKDL